MKKNVEKKIKKCATCNRNKISRHAFYGQLKLLKIPAESWKSIALDFVVKLPLFKEPIIEIKYDSILVITCRFTKYKYFILYIKALTVENLVYIFLKTIISNYRLLKEIILNRNKLFISNF
jgi:hypothetical protein